MTEVLTPSAAETVVSEQLRKEGIAPVSVTASSFPEETVILVKVTEGDFDRAIGIGSTLDKVLEDAGFRGFVTVRASEGVPEAQPGPMKAGVQDPRSGRLVELLTTRSRTSEIQPSLSYVPDVGANASLITAARHHLIFGRRGAGKTALMLEGKRLAETKGALTVWQNIQTYREEPAGRAYLWVLKEVLGRIEAELRDDPKLVNLLQEILSLGDQATEALASNKRIPAGGMIPTTRRALARFSATTGKRVFVFLDDFHYLDRSQQPELLDNWHATIRDCDVWLKVAAIKHLTRWYDSGSHRGLETGHDADHIELDVTLQDPSRAKAFLEEVLRRYSAAVAINSPSRVFSPGALDRLVLASGAVPRDYLTLCARSIKRCQTRANSRIVGVQDVNAAAGDAAKVKIEELEDDLAASESTRNSTLEGLRAVTRFCLDDKAYTYFRVRFREKESKSEEYGVLTALLDVRLLHLLEPSLSDPHKAGERFEVYMLDLSQFSGQRLKHYIRVLDLAHGQFLAKETRRAGTRAVGSNPLKLITILRRAPEFQLSLLSAAV